MPAVASVADPVTVELYMEAHHGGVITTHNVVGEWRGSERPEEVRACVCIFDLHLFIFLLNMSLGLFC